MPLLLNEAKQFLAALDVARKGFAELFRRKRTALTQARGDELQRFTEPEADGPRQLQAALRHRRRILLNADQHRPILQTNKIFAPYADCAFDPPDRLGCGRQTGRAGFSEGRPFGDHSKEAR